VIEVVTTEIERMALRIRGLAQQIARPAGIMRTVAQGVEHQTAVRIHFEKRAPDGKPWAPWSPRYARTRKPGLHSLLMDTWAMVDERLDSKSTATTATVFDTAPYAGFHMTGTRRMPARPFLGISDANARDIENWLGPALDEMAQEALTGAGAT
jgi:phage virion morphogenesis protein